jgi:hypothetical protein
MIFKSRGTTQIDYSTGIQILLMDGRLEGESTDGRPAKERKKASFTGFKLKNTDTMK